MLAVQIVSVATAGVITYYVSRYGALWRTALAVALGLIAGWVVGVTAATIWADGNTDTIGRGVSAAFWFAIIGAAIGGWAGRSRALKRSIGQTSDVASSRATVPTERQSSTGGDKHVKVARMEAWLGKYKPETLDRARKNVDGDPSRVDDEYIELRSKELERQDLGQSETSDPVHIPPSDDSHNKQHGGNTPSNQTVYLILVTLIVILVALAGHDQIKAFIAGFTAPTTLTECTNKYVNQARTETAARALAISCHRQFSSDKPVTAWDVCLRDGKLMSLSTETAAKAHIRECNRS